MSWKGWLVYLLAMLIASLVCIMLQQVNTSDVHVPIIFVLVVLVVSLLTEGYFYGILAALTSVIAVNYASPSKANSVLGWYAKRDLNDMCRDSWNAIRNNPDGYPV